MAPLTHKPLILILGVLAALWLAVSSPLPAAASDRPDSFADLAAKVSPAVVNISTVRTVKGGPLPEFFRFRRPGGQEGPDQRELPDLHEFFRRFFQGPGGPDVPHEFKQRSLGSGVIVDEGGYVLTNNHVVARADKITVRLKDHRELPAKIVGRDPKTDLALIKIETDDDLPYLTLGNSDKLRVGDWVLAVGNPFGLEDTVTAGIVSAKGRIIGAGPYDDFIQTDASINPGNSGGPLLNLEGEVVGINTAIVAQGQGIGFAIPVNIARRVMEQLRSKGRVVRGWLGVYIQPVTKELAEKFKLDNTNGALVTEVIKDGPAEKAGLKRGDVIVEFDGKPIKDMAALPRQVAQTPVGAKVKLMVVRDGRSRPLTVDIGELKEQQEASARPEREVGENRLGLTVQVVTPDLARQLGLNKAQGLVITAVKPGGPAQEAGLRRGDVILQAAQKDISSVAQFNRMASRLKAGEGLLLLIQRREGTMFVVVKAPK